MTSCPRELRAVFFEWEIFLAFSIRVGIRLLGQIGFI